MGDRDGMRGCGDYGAYGWLCCIYFLPLRLQRCHDEAGGVGDGIYPSKLSSVASQQKRPSSPPRLALITWKDCLVTSLLHRRIGSFDQGPVSRDRTDHYLSSQHCQRRCRAPIRWKDKSKGSTRVLNDHVSSIHGQQSTSAVNTWPFKEARLNATVAKMPHCKRSSQSNEGGVESLDKGTERGGGWLKTVGPIKRCSHQVRMPNTPCMLHRTCTVSRNGCNSPSRLCRGTHLRLLFLLSPSLGGVIVRSRLCVDYQTRVLISIVVGSSSHLSTNILPSFVRAPKFSRLSLLFRIIMVLTWFITGCSSGFGESFVRQLRAAGDNVIATGRNANVKLEHLKETGAAILDLDVTAAPDNIATKIDDAWNIYDGGIDVVVNNAGYILSGAVEELT